MADSSRLVGSVISDELVERQRSRIGRFEPIPNPWHSEVTRDAIRHWTEGIGDTNPLWIDEEHAAGTGHGTLVAPPSFLYSCAIVPEHRDTRPSRGGGLPGTIRRMHTGDAWEWFKPIILGDRIHGEDGVADIEVDDGTPRGRSLKTTDRANFYNQRDELVARKHTVSVAWERAISDRGGIKRTSSGAKKHRYSEEELARINQDIDDEVIRGANTLYWDDVQAGEEIPHVVKGPLTTTELIAFCQGWGDSFLMASEILHRYLRKHPRANVPDFDTNAPDTPTRVHWNERLAQQSGFPTGFDIGCQRISWMIHGLTNWMGDEGFLRSAEARFTGLNLLGDTTWCKGVISNKRREGREHLVDLDLYTVNQRGQRTSEGTATVRLPRDSRQV